MDAKIDASIFGFSAKFCNKLDKTKNWAVSPPAVTEITMAAISLGFGTADADDSKIIQTPKKKILPSSYLLLSPKLNSVKGITLHQANKIYLTKNLYKMSENQKKIAKETFNVKIQNINFFKGDDAAKRINKWVEKKTNKKIKQFLNSDGLEVGTHMVFVSGIYFKGIWQMKFDPEDTEEAIFYLNENETVNVFLMYRRERYRYKDCEDLNAQLLLIPFKGEEAHALFVFPRRVTGLDEVLHKLADGYDLMAEVDQMLDGVQLIVRIPRFKIESEINFTDVLHKLDINIPCNRAIQKVLIEVTEEGTERKPDRNSWDFMPWRRSLEFTADHPHLIVILCHNIPIIWVTFRGRFE